MPVHVDTSTLQIDYNSTWINSVLQFRCKKGFFSTDLFTATCLENGTWSPNPANHTCATPSGVSRKVYRIDTGPEYQYFFCAGNFLTPAECNVVIAAVSSITACALSSLLFFIIGYACGCKCGQATSTCTSSDMAPQVSQLNPIALYEEVLPESKPEITNQFELEDNVAYNPLK